MIKEQVTEYKYELHSHTKNTSRCSKLDAKELIEKCKNAGYSGVVITDHYSPMTFKLHELFSKKMMLSRYLRGYKKAKSLESEDFTVLLGVELRFFFTLNDYLIYGVDEKTLEDAPYMLFLYLKRASKYFRNNGCLFLQTHPFRRHIRDVNPKFLDGVEIFNGKASAKVNEKAKKYAQKIGFNIRTSGSDSHNDSNIGLGGIITNEPIRNNDDLIRILRSGEFRIIENQR